jgi:hypothetical protein
MTLSLGRIKNISHANTYMQLANASLTFSLLFSSSTFLSAAAANDDSPGELTAFVTVIHRLKARDSEGIEFKLAQKLISWKMKNKSSMRHSGNSVLMINVSTKSTEVPLSQPKLVPVGVSGKEYLRTSSNLVITRGNGTSSTRGKLETIWNSDKAIFSLGIKEGPNFDKFTEIFIA